jgi:DtxR family Mn-dependent transcriptional regulator
MKNISKEDYLSTIYKHRDFDGTIKANQIAEKLFISNAAVTDMLKKLAKDGLVDYKRYKGIKLTNNGEEYAKNMVRRHRIWEVFLHQVVGMQWDKVHDEAHNLEHSSSDELINRMEEMLDFPEFDPHGDPIPSKEGILPKQKKNIPLSLLEVSRKSKVVRVNDFDDGFLNYLLKIGIELGKIIVIKEILEFDRSMLIVVNGKEMNISSTIAVNVFVEEIED